MSVPGYASMPQPAPPGAGFASPYEGTVVNPRLPYKSSIGHTLQIGEMLIVQGYIPPQANRFHINLQCGSHDTADIALHMNPRFEGINEVVRNSRRSGYWETEEKAGKFPLHLGQSFEMILLVQAESYKIAFNGKHFAEFVHRMRRETVNTLTINGTVNIQSLRFQPPVLHCSSPFGASLPVAPPPAYSPPGYTQNLTVPFTSPIPGGLCPGKMIILSGMPLFGTDRFAIDLVTSRDQSTALHFNPRLNDSVVVRNSMLHGSWGPEERQQPCFPFQYNANFDIIILCEQRQFKVAVNSRHFITYAHRVLNLHEIDTVNVNEGVKLTSVRFQ